jgi:hypothetical protein
MKKELHKTTQKEIASIFGRIGGLAGAKKAGHKGMSARGKKGAKARWNKK